MAPEPPSQPSGVNRLDPINVDKEDPDKMEMVQLSVQRALPQEDPPTKEPPTPTMPGSFIAADDTATFSAGDNVPMKAVVKRSELDAARQDIKNHQRGLFDSLRDKCPQWFATWSGTFTPELTAMKAVVQQLVTTTAADHQKEKQAQQKRLQDMQKYVNCLKEQLENTQKRETTWKTCAQKNMADQHRVQETQQLMARLKEQLQESRQTEASWRTQAEHNLVKSQEMQTTHMRVENLREELQRSEQAVAISKENAKDMQSQIKSLEEKLSQTHVEAANLRRQQAVSKITGSQKVSDATIAAGWKQLHYNIRDLAHHLADAPQFGALYGEANRRFHDVYASYRTEWKDKDLRIFMIRGYLWRVVGGILNSERDVRATKIDRAWKSLHSLVNDAIENDPEKIEKWQQWFVQGWSMLERLEDTHEKALDCVAREMTLISPLLPKSQSDARKESRINDELHNIITSTKRLESIFGCSRAVIRVEWINNLNLSSAWEFDEALMEAVDWSGCHGSSPSVKVVLSPVLLKTGTADGQHYGSRMVLEKAKVVCH